MEDWRRRRVAFEEAAKRMLRYLEDSEDLKVGVTELKEQLEMSEEAGVSIRHPSRQGMRMAKRLKKYSGKEKKRYVLPVWPDGTRS